MDPVQQALAGTICGICGRGPKEDRAAARVAELEAALRQAADVLDAFHAPLAAREARGVLDNDSSGN